MMLPGGTVSFKYDPFGRRIYKSSSAGTSIYAYDGLNLLEETSASGAVVARYTEPSDIDQPLAMLRSGTTSYYEQDGLGSVTSLSNGGGSLAQTYTFDSFGKLTASSGSLTDPFRYTARELDPETDLYYYRARYYSYDFARFVTEDPIKFRGGINFYRYALNSPLNLKDPKGEDAALDGMTNVLQNIFPGSELHDGPGGTYLVIPESCPDVMHTLVAQGYQTGLFPPFNNPIDHAGGWEFRTAGLHDGFHFRMPYPTDPTDPMGMGSPLAPCMPDHCTLDQFHIDPNNPLGGSTWQHFWDFVNSHL